MSKDTKPTAEAIAKAAPTPMKDRDPAAAYDFMQDTISIDIPLMCDGGDVHIISVNIRADRVLKRKAVKNLQKLVAKMPGTVSQADHKMHLPTNGELIEAAKQAGMRAVLENMPPVKPEDAN